MAAKGGNPAKAAKDLENANKRLEKYKEDADKANAKVTELESEHKKLKREREELDKELKRLEGAGMRPEATSVCGLKLLVYAA